MTFIFLAKSTGIKNQSTLSCPHKKQYFNITFIAMVETVDLIQRTKANRARFHTLLGGGEESKVVKGAKRGRSYWGDES